MNSTAQSASDTQSSSVAPAASTASTGVAPSAASTPAPAPSLPPNMRPPQNMPVAPITASPSSAASPNLPTPTTATTDAGTSAPTLTSTTAATPSADPSVMGTADTSKDPASVADELTKAVEGQLAEASVAPSQAKEAEETEEKAPDLSGDPSQRSPVANTVPAPQPTAAVPTTPPAIPAGEYNNLLDVLLAQNKVTQEQANELKVENISTGKRVDQLVEEKNIVSEEDLTQAKAALNSIPFVKLADVGIYPEAINQLPEGSARHYQMVPFAYNKQDGTLSVAMKNPLDLTAIDFAQQKTGLRILAYYATPTEVERAIAEYYSQTLSSEVSAALEQTTQVAEAQTRKQDLTSLGNETIRSAPITKIVETMVTFAIKSRASDIHVEPLEDRTRIRYRIDGILTEKLILPKSVHDAVVSRIKILSGLKIDEKRLPQDGRFNFAADEQEVDLRVSTLPTINGEKIVMRLLKKDMDVPTLKDLGLDGLGLHNVENAIKVPHGIILITGPTGSGKTTTLYSILHKINSPKVNIMTLEDPVEYQIAGVNQVQVNPQAGLTFASGLRSFLRQDPNIIMVGEIRDSETAELAIQAALTGHLVFSTLHTSSAAGALPRLMDMGAEPFLLASSMTLVMAQRVLRKINPKYVEKYKPEPAVVKDIQTVLGDKFAAWCKQKGVNPQDIQLSRPAANRPQTEPEFKGRIAIFEVMKINDQISKMILDRTPASEMEKLAVKDGMSLMKQDGYIKALEGITTIEEVLRVAQI